MSRLAVGIRILHSHPVLVGQLCDATIVSIKGKDITTSDGFIVPRDSTIRVRKQDNSGWHPARRFDEYELMEAAAAAPRVRAEEEKKRVLYLPSLVRQVNNTTSVSGTTMRFGKCARDGCGRGTEIHSKDPRPSWCCDRCDPQEAEKRRAAGWTTDQWKCLGHQYPQYIRDAVQFANGRNLMNAIVNARVPGTHTVYTPNGFASPELCNEIWHRFEQQCGWAFVFDRERAMVLAVNAMRDTRDSDGELRVAHLMAAFYLLPRMSFEGARDFEWTPTTQLRSLPYSLQYLLLKGDRAHADRALDWSCVLNADRVYIVRMGLLMKVFPRSSLAADSKVTPVFLFWAGASAAKRAELMDFRGRHLDQIKEAMESKYIIKALDCINAWPNAEARNGMRRYNMAPVPVPPHLARRRAAEASAAARKRKAPAAAAAEEEQQQPAQQRAKVELDGPIDLTKVEVSDDEEEDK